MSFEERIVDWTLDWDDIELESEIGQGGFGTVFKGTWRGEEVALKKLVDFGNDEIFRKLMQREVLMLIDAAHDNVVKFHGLSKDEEDNTFVVTAYLACGDLRRLLKNKDAPLPYSVRIEMLLDVASAMQSMHDRNIVHRDLKSKNLLVTDELRLVLCDFGVARVTDEDHEQNQRLTMAGSDLWMAPEVSMRKPYNSKADVFSFGCVMYEMITREKPPQRKIVPDRYAFKPDAFKEVCPDDCPTLLLKLAEDSVAANPDERPSFQIISQALTMILGQVEDGQAELWGVSKKSQGGSIGGGRSLPPPPSRRGRPMPSRPQPALPPPRGGRAGTSSPHARGGMRPSSPSVGRHPGPPRISGPSGPPNVSGPSGPPNVGGPSGPPNVGGPSGPPNVGRSNSNTRRRPLPKPPSTHRQDLLKTIKGRPSFLPSPRKSRQLSSRPLPKPKRKPKAFEDTVKTWTVDWNDCSFDSVIGEGGFGTVYKGSYKGRDVALKKLIDFGMDEIFQKLMQREIEMLIESRHPNVIKFMGLVTSPERETFIITQYLPCGDLRKLLKQKEVDIPWTVRVEMTIDVASAMTVLHQRNIVHRDLKSKNLLVTGELNLVLCDFGVARVTDEDAEVAQQLTMAGSDLWMAPEVAMRKKYNTKADVFSFGCVMYEMISRSKPPVRTAFPNRFAFPEGTFESAAERDCPLMYVKLAKECCAVNPDDRPPFDVVEKILGIVLTELETGKVQTVGGQVSRAPDRPPPPPPRKGRPPMSKSGRPLPEIPRGHRHQFLQQLHNKPPTLPQRKSRLVDRSRPLPKPLAEKRAPASREHRPSPPQAARGPRAQSVRGVRGGPRGAGRARPSSVRGRGRGVAGSMTPQPRRGGGGRGGGGGVPPGAQRARGAPRRGRARGRPTPATPPR